MKVFGLVDIEVIAAGSVFLGTVHEPIKGTKNPQAMLQSGVPFSKKPKALRFDYKVKAAPEKNRVRSTGFSRKSTVAGQDSLAVILLLQKRWEDEEGNVYTEVVPLSSLDTIYSNLEILLGRAVTEENRINAQRIYQIAIQGAGSQPDRGDSLPPGTGLGEGSFSDLMAEATKYIGYPYLMGGSSPGTGSVSYTHLTLPTT